MTVPILASPAPLRLASPPLAVVLILMIEGVCALLLLQHSGLLKTRAAWVVSTVLLVLGLGLRGAVFSYETLDYQNFLARWVEFFRQHGGFAALKYEIGNYNIPYLYFLALFSLLPLKDLYFIKLLSTAYFTAFFLPTVFLNSAVWGQCDSLYAAPLVLGVWCALDGRPAESVILAAVAFGFKLQAVFVLPVYAVFLMTGKIKWKHVLLFPVTYLILVLPAVCAGRPLWETVTLYFSQTGSIGSGLNYNSPSVFSVFTDIRNPAAAATVGICLAVFYMLNLLAVSWVYRDRMNDKAILALCLLFAIGIPFFLPHMHERYFYAADIFSLVLAFAVPLCFPVALLVQFASLLGYHAYLKMRYLLLMNHGAAALIAAFALTLLCFIGAIREGLPKRRRKKAAS